MKIEPIEIDINDEKLFTDVMLAVGQERFKELVGNAREKLGLKNLLSDKEFVDFKNKYLHFPKGKLLKKLEEDIRIKQRLPITFKGIIRKSILCGKVKDSDYKLAYLEIQRGVYDEETDFLDLTPSIIFSPYARGKDILETWQEYNDYIGNDKEKSVESYKYIPKEIHTEKMKPAIKRHYKWYLSSQKGLSPKDILDEAGEDEAKLDEKTIKDGVNNIKKLLRESRVS